MPRKVNPGSIRTGVGKRTPEKGNILLEGVSGASVGNLFNTPAAEVDAIDGLEGGAPGLKAHVNYPKNAHPAQAISIDPYPPLYMGEDVNAALDELAALIPPMPPTVGNYSGLVSVSGIPDWGSLKLAEAPLDARGVSFLVDTNDNSEIYPYYWYPPHPAQEYPPFEPDGTLGPLKDEGGNDPATDPVFNIANIPYSGGGQGKTYAGAFTRSGTDYTLSARLMEFTAASRPVVVSGVVFPADRGVLALLHWPPDGTIFDFLAQPLGQRCIAATLLGSGIIDGADGLPGGMFTPGTEGSVPSNPYDPFAFPGQASGQFDLEELHTGVYGVSFPLPIQGGPLPSPFNPGNNTLGQVRLGTDPRAGITPLANGLPILGGTTFARGGGNNQNFFRYRLPYWDNYSQDGLVYTPDMELPRWFKKPSISLDPFDDLTNGGNYPNLSKKYWAFQMARYRHRFTLTNVGATGLVESGDYVLVHFKREEWFEDFVRDGNVPAYDKIYTPQLGDWNYPGAAFNISALPAELDGASPAYHTIRGTVAEDSDALNTPVLTASTYDYTRVTDFVMHISGVAYFLPLQFSGGGAGTPNFQVTSLAVGLTNFFRSTYRTHDLNTDYIHNPNPFFLAMPHLTYSTESTNPFTVPLGFVSDAADQIRRQRIEFRFEDLGPYTTVTPPVPSAGGAVVLAGQISFGGDFTQPACTENARIRGFARRPVGHESPGTTVFPPTGFVLTNPFSPEKILYHSTRWDGALVPPYGNFTNGGTGYPETGLETPLKDTEERFLDEIYRWHADWPSVTPAANRSNLLGPGLAGTAGIPTPILDLPVRAGTPPAPYSSASWAFTQAYNLSLLVASVNNEAQVAGLPDRNPPITDGVTSPFPSSGVMLFPHKNYTTGYRPSNAAGDITGTQFDYSTIPTTGDREYVRGFDVDFSRDSSVNAAGQPYFTIRIRGLKRENYAYANWEPSPGPKGISIYVKVPGVTTWMDLGRPDGAGPSKQDAALDGAGCQVVGVGTFDERDAATGVVYSQVRVNVGPGQNLFLNSYNEVPVLVKTVIHDNANGLYFNFEQGGVTGTTDDVRGLVGIEIVKPE